MSVSSVPACEPGQVVHPRLRWFLSLALMSALLNSSVPTPLYPHYQAALALSDLGLSLIYGGYAGGVLIALFGVGNLAGRVADLRTLILPALVAVGGGALLFSLADSFWALLLARLLAGIGTGSLTGAANVALLESLCDTMFNGSMCAMGGMTPFPVLSALDGFPEDFGVEGRLLLKDLRDRYKHG